MTPWWRIAGWPSAEEWQALASILGVVVTAIAIAFTLVQLRLGRQANQLAASAAERAAKAAEDEARPYIAISLDLKALAPGDPKKQVDEGLVYVRIDSVGRTPARDVSFTVDPPFETSGRGKPAGGPDPVQETLNTVFGGGFKVGMLGTGPTLYYLLDFAKEALDPASLRPKSYTVTARYWNADCSRAFTEESILDLAPLSMSIVQIDPLETIARQVRRLNEKGLP